VLERLEVGAVLHPDIPGAWPDQRRATAVARARSVPLVVVRRGDRFRVGRLDVEVVWPADGGRPGEDPNLYAVVLLVSFGDVDVLLTADAESEVTGRLPLPPVEVLKVAHHGSEDPGLARQLRSLRPSVAVISVGAGNRYDHPRPETLQALADAPALTVLRTDLDGRVVVESDGRTLTTRAERG
jgi:competence protein ComEC